MTDFADLLGAPRNEAALLDGLNGLTRHHRAHCPAYARIMDRLWPAGDVQSLAQLPYVPVGLFKRLTLSSVAEDKVVAVLTSSGTTGQQPSRVTVDGTTMDRQNRALSASLKQVLGPKRLPMLLIDTAQVLRDPKLISARGAGLLGLMRHGRDHVFALNADLSPDDDAITSFLARHGSQPFAIFGFTFMVWQRLYHACRQRGLDLSNAILIHSGGWKAMTAQMVDNAQFRAAFRQDYGVTRIHNFYGMAEQLGSVFMEAEDGWLYPSAVSHAIIRNPETWQPAPPGTEGVIQVLSLVPLSYPGHSLLTEDWGVQASDGGLKVLGRVPRAPLRGCSDVLAEGGR